MVKLINMKYCKNVFHKPENGDYNLNTMFFMLFYEKNNTTLVSLNVKISISKLIQR